MGVCTYVRAFVIRYCTSLLICWIVIESNTVVKCLTDFVIRERIIDTKNTVCVLFEKNIQDKEKTYSQIWSVTEIEIKENWLNSTRLDSLDSTRLNLYFIRPIRLLFIVSTGKLKQRTNHDFPNFKQKSTYRILCPHRTTLVPVVHISHIKNKNRERRE